MMDSLIASKGSPAGTIDPSADPAHEPIAIVGVGCRFPGGASDPAAFWRLLEEGRDCITEVPAERWSTRAFYDPRPGKPGKTQTRWGGFLDGIDRFDPVFFGISPREAARMDPQQRLLLETAWEALEDGGQTLERLSGSRAAVFVGISSWDYSLLQLSVRDRGTIDVYSNTGGSLSIAANRISYCFDFRGPSAAVDTACSSALLAVHLACQSIWVDRCPLALAGGVSALLMPDWYVGFSRLGMLSPDGRCRAFDARANGFVRSEGAGMVALKPLAQALADGDRIYAVIRGTAANQDGRTPGMTVPSQEAQEELVRQACRSAGVAPSQIHYVEAHGTGTLVGDPIEARALGNVLSAGRPAGQPCLLGSVKTNIGHLEAGAGIAGLIKAALAVYHRRIPGNLHFEQPNPDIDFDALRLRVPVRSEPWPDGPATAGVNSFGYGGSNAHVVLQAAPGDDDKVTRWQGDKVTKEEMSSPCHLATLSPCHLLPLSARSPEALRDLARSMARLVAESPAEVSLADVAWNAAVRRTHHEHRLAAVAQTKQELAEQLEAFAAGQSSTAVAADRAPAGKWPRLAFVFSGQGPQWWAMGRQLLTDEPVFRQVIEQCDTIVRRLGDWSLMEELTADEAKSRMSVTAISQPAIFALQAGLAELWRTWGVRPEAVIGHSVGEVAAAYLAGVFSLEDAVRVIYQRGRCMELAPARGRMLAASLTAEEARAAIAPHGERVSLAAINGPTSVTLSGDAGPLEEIARELEKRQVFCRFLQVNYAFHSAQMDPVRDELLRSLQGIQPRPATLPFYSTVTGQRVDGPELGPEYWWRNVRQGVRFADGVARLIEMDCDTVLELGPHPVLASAVTECCQHAGKKANVLWSLKRHEPERATLLRSLGKLYALGQPIAWPGVLPGPRPFLQLPLYPWQRERYWHEPEEARRWRLGTPAHPLLGSALGEAMPSWENRLDLPLFPYLNDHRIQRAVLMPAAAYLELSLAAAREQLGPVPCQLEDVKLANPCFLSPDHPLRLQTAFRPEDAVVQVHTRPSDGGQEWTPHVSAVVRLLTTEAPKSFCPDAVKQLCPNEFSGAECIAYSDQIGLNYGPLFQGIERIWQGERQSLGIVQLPEALAHDADDYVFHPALLDACFQVAIPAGKEFKSEISGLYLPSEMEQVRLYRRPGRRLWVHCRLLEKTSRALLADLDIYDQDGQPVAQVRGLRCQRVAGRSPDEALDDLLYAYRWEPREIADCGLRIADCSNGNGHAHWLIFADCDLGERLAERLRTKGERCTVVYPGIGFARCGEDSYRITPGNRDEMLQLLRVSQPCNGIIHLWSQEAGGRRPEAGVRGQESGVRSQESGDFSLTPDSCLLTPGEAGLLSVPYLVQAWEQAAGEQSARLFLVTRGAQSVGEKPERTAVAQAPVIGLGRVIVSEYPRLRCKLVDLDAASADEDNLRWLLDELGAADEEDEVAVRSAGRFVHRFQSDGERVAEPVSGQAGPYRLASLRPGTLDGLAPRAQRRQPPGPGQVEIEVVAAGLNFSDVMKALGIYPGLPDGPVPLGGECSGRIVTVGEGVEDLRVGDEVLAVAPFSFGSHVVTRAELVTRKPARLSFEEAATIPIAFLTAAHALDQLGRLSHGERVLIHSATGGVGLAAIQLARRAGAEVFATAGTPEKRDYLATLGIEHAMDSRSTAFADQVLERTGGRGVDVILNSLAGDAIARGLSALADYGRFLEIGKRDIYDNSRLGLRPFRKNLSFFAIDLDRMVRERPAVVGDLLRRLVRDFEADSLRPLPHQDFPITQAAYAFRHMQQGKHIGKVVLSLVEPPAAVVPSDDEPVTFRGDASYLITGGLGGFGLAVARWLAQRGAKHLVLASRRGLESPGAVQAVAELEKLGARACVLRADVSREEDVISLLAEIDRTMPPLRGVLHSAMVLEDSLLVNLDRDLMERVLAPKVSGSWNLHRHTLERPLDFFILFSSLSSVFGHAGQGNYAAANAFLDSLAWHRRALGLPALTINWGYLGEVGYLAERRQLGERLERQGVLSFSVREALVLLERAMQRNKTQVSVMRVEWSRWRGLGVTGRISPRFAHLCQQAGSAAGPSQQGVAALDAVRSAAPGDRRSLLDSVLRGKVARVLGSSADRLDADKPLLNLGIDSLMAVELRNWIENELEVNLPIVELMRSPSLSRLTDLLLENLSKENGAAERSNGHGASQCEASPEELLAKIDQMSGEQVDSLLATLLAEPTEINGSGSKLTGRTNADCQSAPAAPGAAGAAGDWDIWP